MASEAFRFLKPRGTIAFASAGLMSAFDDAVPDHLEEFWQVDCWGIQTSQWWRHHWERTGLVNIKVSDSMSDGREHWGRWAEANGGGPKYMNTLRTDGGRYLGYVRTIACRIPSRELLPYDLMTGR